MSVFTDFLNQAKKELLDFGLRNQLINFKLPKARGIKLETLPLDIFKSLITENKTVGISGLDEDEEPTLKDGFQTKYEEDDLNKRLKKTMRDARSHLEERGINILFLSLGSLEWFEEKDPNKKYKAPLILLPVELKLNDKTKHFTVVTSDDEVQENISLKEKLRLEYGIEIPQLNLEETEFNILEYFKNVQLSIEKMKGWQVDIKEAYISFFNFNKFIMYQDLDEQKWLDEQNKEWPEIFRKLLDESFKFNEPRSQISEDDYLEDYVDASEPTAVLDADSSQSKAILDVRNGANLVIQGPPGTGKSQTIANIIADAIRHNKKVLFVAEKTAALQAVSERLKDVNLFEACLELHSHNANKKYVFEELEKVLRLSKPKSLGSQENVDELKSLATNLNEYMKVNNSFIDKTKFTPFMVTSILSKASSELESITIPPNVLDALDETVVNSFIEMTYADFLSNYMEIEKFQNVLTKVGGVRSNPFYGSSIKSALPSDIEKLSKTIDKAIKLISINKEAIETFSKKLKIKNELNAKEIDLIVEALVKAPEISSVKLELDEWASKRDDLSKAIKLVENIQEVKSNNESLFIANVWTKNLTNDRQVLNTTGRKFMSSLLSSELKEAKLSIQKLFKNKPPTDIDELIAVIDLIEDVRVQATVIKKYEKSIGSLLGDIWLNDKTDTEKVKEVATYIYWLNSSVKDKETLDLIISLLKRGTKADDVIELNKNVIESYGEVKAIFEEIKKMLVVDDAFFADDYDYYMAVDATIDYNKAADKLLLIKDNIKKIQDWINLVHFVDNLKLHKLDWIYSVAQNWPEGYALLPSLFSRQVMEEKLKDIHTKNPILKTFNRDTQLHLIDRFGKLDLMLQQFRQSEISNIHYENVRRAGSASIGEMGVIRTQIQRKRRIALRKLFSQAGHAVQELKPVIMMSPLSVASFVPPKTLTFDLIIFDEASQVKPVDALGAVLRGKQLVVVGDSKQMPPTTFFESQIIGDEEDLDLDDDDVKSIKKNAATDSMESILSLMVAQNAPERMLQWHYRSQYSSLIAVSNFEFYDSRLKLFPHAHENIKENGLIFRHIKNGTYDRGGTRSNEVEAKAVAEAILNHAKNNSNETLGVVAFSIAQKEAIEDQVELLAKKHPELVTFFDMHDNKKMFIKNLETIQGDERDVIFISIGYARTPEGFLMMSFGPLNRDGGERRMNVLISRAKKRCEVFSSITSDEIDIEKSKVRGVIVLKSFLRYAKDRVLDTTSDLGKEESKGYGSDFEEEVARVIRHNGYDVDIQVGSAGFSIDLAVKNPKLPGSYLLAIECDGATYHSSRSARERDRLRQDVLEARGWDFHRVWSTAWLRDRANETQKILDAIKVAEKKALTKFSEMPKKKISPTIIERTEDKDIDISLDPNAQGEWVVPYQSAKLNKINIFGGEFCNLPIATITKYLEEVVKIESPIHIELAARRLIHAAGLTKVGNRIQSAVINAAQYGNKKEIFHYDASALTLSINGSVNVPIRDRSNSDEYTKDPLMITKQEIIACAKKRCQGAINPVYQELLPIMCKDFGYKRATTEMKKYFQSVIQEAIKANKWNTK